MLTFRAIGIDYDGTLTQEERPSSDVLQALKETRNEGVRLVLVTGRILAELRAVFPDVDAHFDAIVAENGTVLARPGGDRRLAMPPPLEFDEALLHRGVLFRRGQVLLASTKEYAAIVLEELTKAGLECHIVRNRGEIMVLPSGASKGVGLAAALADLGISPHDAVGIGDAENDHSLLEVCELGVAVANAVPALRARADLLLEGQDGNGVSAFLRGPVIRGGQRTPPVRWSVELGRTQEGAPIRIPASAVNVRIEGPTLAGKSYVAGLLAESLIRQGYSVCVLDPEGDHASLARLHACMAVGGHEPLPPAERIAGFFRPTFGSLVADLSQLPSQDRAQASVAILEAVQRQREESGFPQWIVLDEAHATLAVGEAGCEIFRPEQKGFCLVTYQPERLCACAADCADFVVRCDGAGHARFSWQDGQHPDVVFQLGRRSTGHVRHRHKYAHGGLPPEHRFYLRNGAGPIGRSAGSLQEFHRELRACDDSVLRHHAMSRDLSRWVAEVIRDDDLSEDLGALELAVTAMPSGEPVDALRRAILDAIERRYLG